MNWFLSALAVVLALALPAAASAQPDPWAKAERKPGFVQAISAKLNEEAWLVPGASGAVLKARVFRPASAGPYKVAVINHGSPAKASERPTMAVPSYRAAAEWFVGRGYMVVMPLRRGYGESGPWPESYGACATPDYVAAGKAGADDILAVVGYLRSLKTVRNDRILLVGQSAGGFGVVAATARNPEGVFAAINIAGGRGGHQGGRANENCAPDRLVTAMRTFGSGAKVPSLWLYTRNDSFFEPALSQRMAEAYRAAGGRNEYVLLPAYKTDGHEMFSQADGRLLWTGPVAEFLGKVE
ncbi:MAG: alpha/beta fold hydrolase [Alphaproteobacteria bacterium]|nr:alpha/beta fold hydrolase [Alphaproteobacteria bacterium]